MTTTDWLDGAPPSARRMLDAVIAAVESDQRYVGLMVGGSGATGTMDEFSDLDLVLVCRDESHAELLPGLPAFAAGLGPVLTAFTGEHVGEPRLLIALYGPPLLHVDLKLVSDSQLDERVEDGRVVWERDGAVQTALVRVAAVWPQPDVQWIEDRFWGWVHYMATKIGRGELFDCLSALSFLRQRVFGPLIALRHGQRPSGVRRIESFAPEAVPALEATLGSHDRIGCARAVRAAVDLYRELREAYPEIRRHPETEQASLDYLADIEARFAGPPG